ncbi:class I SAM-dependent methyltransferase [Desulfocurvus sp.]|jgi:demethylmenaquinone methyltransferase/2-methoxy-6-polyprenyl-1,4-benzoquinol methylase|uniref:class I SAM-dependent methyltransferase n=1 Tax=Desulfocurvus sp. TaxID=2871698 RepID=UPI0025C01E80|nr:class I SAM-dependent methyltransferase [Desulfocurvus sp.]MCK9240930.1 class I SAM-dependent methyltransferase [Desulfocurvus sp.]
MNEKGREFKGLWGGKHYRRWAALFGMGPEFYRRGLGDLELGDGMRALDLGCGPGALSLALAQRAAPGAAIVGLDLSEDQLAYARTQAGGHACALEFRRGSMDELPYPDGHFDLVMTSMALHETPPAVRRAAVAETARVLRPGGLFLLVDWSRPRLGLWGVLWFPLVCRGEKNRDNWNNVYPALCAARSLDLAQDGYINSMVRRQLFRKS